MQINSQTPYREAQKQVENLRTHCCQRVTSLLSCCLCANLHFTAFQVFLSRYCGRHLVRDLSRKFLFLYVHEMHLSRTLHVHTAHVDIYYCAKKLAIARLKYL